MNIQPIKSYPREPLMIASYAHKGGVGKTTGIHNIAFVLAREFKARVLLVDADPQASLTGVIMRQNFLSLGEKALNEFGENGHLTDSAERLQASLDAILSQEEVTHDSRWQLENEFKIEVGEMLFYKKRDSEMELNVQAENGMAEERNPLEEEDDKEQKQLPKLQTIYECLNPPTGVEFTLWLQKNTIKDRIKQISPVKIEENLLFIAGDVLLNTLEHYFSSAIAFGAAPNLRAGHIYFPGAVNRIFREVAQNNDIDIILVDLNPGTSALNQAFIMNSNYIVMPNLADFYSRRAVTSIAKVLKSWDELASRVFRDKLLTTEYFALPSGPKILGYLYNRVKIITDKPTIDKRQKMNLVQKEFEERIFKDEDYKFLITNDFDKRVPAPVIKDYDRAADKAIEAGLPMSYITFEAINENPQNKNIKRYEVVDQQEYYLNAYYVAITIIFRNLSPAHHSRLSGKFLPVSTIEYPIIPVTTDTEFCASIPGSGEILFRKCPENSMTNAILATGFDQEDIIKHVTRILVKKAYADYDFNKDYDGFVTECGLKDLEYQNRETAYKIAIAKYQSARDSLNPENWKAYRNDLNEITLLSLAAQPHKNKHCIAFVTSHRQLKIASIALQEHQASLFKGAFENENMGKVRLIGLQSLQKYAVNKEKSLRIWTRTEYVSRSSNLPVLQELYHIGNEPYVEILHERNNVFSRLLVIENTSNESFERLKFEEGYEPYEKKIKV